MTALIKIIKIKIKLWN